MAEATSKSSGMETIDPQGKHPDNAVYVAKDRKSGAEVSFDSWGRKLDSNGNVVHGDRQRAGDAGAKVIRRLVEPDVPKGPPAQPKNGYVIGAGISPAPAQRSGWDNSVLPGTASAATARPANFNVPNRAELNNNWLYGAGKLKGAGGWESGGSPLERQWRTPAQAQQAQPVQQGPSYEFPEYAPSFDNSMPVPEPTPLGIPQATQPNAFEQASVYWGPGGLPMPNNRRFDPGQEQYSVYPMQKPYQPSYQPQGLPVLNNQQFDPYQP